ncbi:MAG: nucleotidyltransferase domain-containing protein [Lachnospiraceae bacterium]|nr:nucleotidyltransferase domain-containing protein [Lachnospiraceae bacterium]
MSGQLKELRKNRNLTQKQTAEQLRVSLRSYKSYENDPEKEGSLKYQYMIDRLNALYPLDETHGILSLSDIKEGCNQVFQEYPISFAYLFGSYAKERAKENSDVDLLVATDLSGLRVFGLVDKIRQTLQKNIDLVTTDQLCENKELLEEILKDGIKIYG